LPFERNSNRFIPLTPSRRLDIDSSTRNISTLMARPRILIRRIEAESPVFWLTPFV